MLKWLTNLFKKECKCTCCKIEEPELITIERRGFQITLEKKVYEFLKSNGYSVSITTYKGEPSCVQLKYRNKETKKTSYVATLKDWLEVKSFKDGNVCNFDPKNLTKE